MNYTTSKSVNECIEISSELTNCFYARDEECEICKEGFFFGKDNICTKTDVYIIKSIYIIASFSVYFWIFLIMKIKF